MFPTPLVSIYQETCRSLNLPAPAASLHLQYPHLQGCQCFGGSSYVGCLAEAVRRRPGTSGAPPRGRPAVGPIQIQPMAACKQTQAPPHDE